MSDLIDADGYRANVAIVLCNDDRQVFWAGRVGRRGWQFPQGGIQAGEEPLAAMYRELHEEVGLGPDDVEVLGKTADWLTYRLPKRYQRRRSEPLCVGQKQVWYLLKLTGSTGSINFSNGEEPEFDRWCWVDFWYPLRKVIFFKRGVYEKALEELSTYLFDDDVPARKEAKRRSPVRRLPG